MKARACVRLLMFLRSTYISRTRSQHVFQRNFIQTSAVTKFPTALNNILSGGPMSNVQVKKLSSRGVELEDGLILPAACIFLNGKVFLWDVPTSLWNGWTPNHLELFEIVVPKPGKFYRYDIQYICSYIKRLY